MANESSSPDKKRTRLLLRYRGFEKTPSVEILRLMLPGAPEYDGGLQGVSFRWLKRKGNRQSWFYPCKSVEQFFGDERFRNLEFVV